MTKYAFTYGAQYGRREVKAAVVGVAGTKGGPWDTGYAEHDGVFFIFCNIGSAGRTGHDYDNYFDGDDLIWRGRTGSTQDQPFIRRLTTEGTEVHVFWRDNERAPFTYGGRGRALKVTADVPVMVRWELSPDTSIPPTLPKNHDQLPAEVLSEVTAAHVFNAVQRLLGGEVDLGPFGPSTDYDLIVGNNERLPPKAVFGLAATDALGFTVLPKHFSSGEGSLCFRILRKSGYAIVDKGATDPTPSPTLSSDELEQCEGKPRLVVHMVRERGKGLREAKKAQFRKEHSGRLYCERCEIDPVAHYNSPHAEACIEVHHDAVQVKDMAEDHVTRLEDLKCLCANCHRLVHREMRHSAQ